MSNKTTKLPFKVSARTAKLIGLENFSTEEGAVIELVKNTYDADASKCILIFDLKIRKEKFIDAEGLESIIEKFDKEGSSIYIIDNGIGMNDLIIQNQWMTIGTDNKLYEHTTKGNRVKTGAKGIGRFALNRLGMLTNMTSLPTMLEVLTDDDSSAEIDSNAVISTKLIPNSESIGFEWTVDWKDFDKVGATVSDVEAVLLEKEDLALQRELVDRFKDYSKLVKILEAVNFKSGTVIEITELNDEWNDEKLVKLFGNLEMLLPPEEQNDFGIEFFVLNNPEEYGTVKRAYYDDFDYKIKASYNENDDKILKVDIIRNELDIDALENRYSKLFEMEMMKESPFKLEDFKSEKIQLNIPIANLTHKVDQNLLDKIGKFDFTFYFLKLTVADDKVDGDLKKYPYKSINSAERRSWLKKFGGIKIFRDDFRIRPYGENGDDWLRLGERQAQSPGGAGQRLGGYRIRPNQIAGTIKISRLHNTSFQDKSGREGLIENDEFDLFKNILREIISLFERDRNIIMYNLSELYKISNREAEKLRKAKEQAEAIRKQKDERKENVGAEDQGRENEGRENEGQSSNENKGYSESEEDMADAILILEKENEKKDEELRLLRSLASVGLIISSFAHEVRSLRARLIPRTKYLVDELKNHLDYKQLEESLDKDDNPFYMIDLMRDEDVKLKHWLDYSLSTLKIDKRERKNLNFSEYFESFKANWSKALEQRNITLHLIKLDDSDHVIRAFEVNMDSIFNNLLSNSINAHYGYNREKKKIEITCQKKGTDIEIIFSDNGKGLDTKYRDNPEEIFNLNESSKTDNKGTKIGTGLGLYIVKTIIEEYNNSSISIIKMDDGLSFKIIFKTRA
ncbi:sensor histidine kinase [Flavobacterium defluvii]|uniref:Signal transduction histidine kinase n=1 Tax=Flavobacterium defluvii TaxID=370979 RepID=A0A1M5JG32_9FLAO|nr:ATP-binding protein [Flavobacterium defluvii]SHG39229.1 Signal transduction histidine kinase [Flavobacterium defluvii]